MIMSECRSKPETPKGYCHINSSALGRAQALGILSDAGCHFPGIERFELMVMDSEGGAAADRDREAVAG